MNILSRKTLSRMMRRLQADRQRATQPARAGSKTAWMPMLLAVAGAALLSANAGRSLAGCIDDPCKFPSLGYLFESDPSFHHRNDDARCTFCEPCYGYHAPCWHEWQPCCEACQAPGQSTYPGANGYSNVVLPTPSAETVLTPSAPAMPVPQAPNVPPSERQPVSPPPGAPMPPPVAPVPPPPTTMYGPQTPAAWTPQAAESAPVDRLPPVAPMPGQCAPQNYVLFPNTQLPPVVVPQRCEVISSEQSQPQARMRLASATISSDQAPAAPSPNGSNPSDQLPLAPMPPETDAIPFAGIPSNLRY